MYFIFLGRLHVAHLRFLRTEDGLAPDIRPKSLVCIVDRVESIFPLPLSEDDDYDDYDADEPPEPADDEPAELADEEPADDEQAEPADVEPADDDEGDAPHEENVVQGNNYTPLNSKCLQK